MHILLAFASFFISVYANIAPQTAILNNGLKIAVFQNPMVPSVTVLTAYDVGTADDPLDMVGLSHMLEHMMFKGSAKYPKGAIDKLVSLNGGWLNAWTSFDKTVYILSLPAEHLELALEIESDRMENLEIIDEEFLQERKVVLEERLMRIGNHPLKTAIDVAQRCRFVAHPYGTMPIGLASHINSYTADALKAHYKKWYKPNNATLVIVGPYNLENILPMVEKYFGSISSSDLSSRMRTPEPARDGITTTIEQESERMENIVLEFDYHMPTFAQDSKKMITMQVLLSILTGSNVRNFFKTLVKDKRLALSLSVDYLAGKDDQGFSISLVLSPGMSVELAEKVLFEKIAIYLKRGLLNKEFNHSKQEMLNSLAFAKDGDKYLIAVAYKYIDGFTKESLENYKEVLTSITLDDVNDMFRQIFMKPPVLITRIFPKGKMHGREYQKVMSN